MPKPEIARIGLTAILFSFRSAKPDIRLQYFIWTLDARMQTLSDIAETSPGVNSLLVQVKDLGYIAQAQAALSACWAQIKQQDCPSTARREIDIPVIYGGAFATDMKALSLSCGLTIEQIAKLHAGQTYDALCLGAHPGFAYLAGLPPQLFMPRKKTPSPAVEQGAVVIGGSQTGIIAATLPSGWNIIGRTQVPLFNPQDDEPALIRPGDRIRFSIMDIIND
ncbi:hypothetical protein B5M10_05880 [Pluralibacter gergoviae]|uniref:5-oxoprolinase subunit PxpB n=1 Tax=Pluralibacter gergoviae TaxID=61647 RepID=UPI000696ED90|nr:5-oxoprolinase subunit PxpB [Pluralibacter gergoviae]OUR03814.1 hypothetical protein B5M10_05880 [Pluralibacter gergoviae]